MKKLVLVGIMALSMASFAQNENNNFSYLDSVRFKSVEDTDNEDSVRKNIVIKEVNYYNFMDKSDR